MSVSKRIIDIIFDINYGRKSVCDYCNYKGYCQGEPNEEKCKNEVREYLDMPY